jgi:putative nucleotidyltransferase with HDIG domain
VTNRGRDTNRWAVTFTLHRTLEVFDRYLAGHSAAVAVYARDIAARLELPRKEQDLAYTSGLLHDIGKVGLPPGLLAKPGELTLEEHAMYQQHAAIGSRILEGMEAFEEIARAVRHHHERFDGLGYPAGLRGEEIPPLARIIAVADAYAGMVADRPERDAMPSRVARMRLAQEADAAFDSRIVSAFEAILAEADEAYRTARSVTFITSCFHEDE